MNDVAFSITPKSKEIFECKWHAKLHNSENVRSVREFSIQNVLSNCTTWLLQGQGHSRKTQTQHFINRNGLEKAAQQPISKRNELKEFFNSIENWSNRSNSFWYFSIQFQNARVYVNAWDGRFWAFFFEKKICILVRGGRWGEYLYLICNKKRNHNLDKTQMKKHFTRIDSSPSPIESLLSKQSNRELNAIDYFEILYIQSTFHWGSS